MPQPDSDDEFPDDIGHLDLSNVPGLQELPAPPLLVRSLDTAVPASPPQLSTSSLPSEYDCDDEIDEHTLAACDAIEARFAQDQNRHQDHSTTAPQATTIHAADARKRGLRSPGLSPASKKGKITAENKTIIANTILEGFDTEINCPICFDILVAAHLCNPCGHSCCGECAQGWVSQNKMSPTCAVCRTALSAAKPLIPNYTLDGVVQQYVRALGVIGRSEWQKKGERLAEWNKRNDKWRRLVAISTAQAEAAKAKKDTHRGVLRLPRTSPYTLSIFDTYLVGDDDDDDEDPTYEQDEPVEVLPRRIMPSRRRTIVS